MWTTIRNSQRIPLRRQSFLICCSDSFYLLFLDYFEGHLRETMMYVLQFVEVLVKSENILYTKLFHIVILMKLSARIYHDYNSADCVYVVFVISIKTILELAVTQ